jgi:Cdc6-like AAA superfamily ATPase
MGEITLANLVNAAQNIFAREASKTELGTVIRAPQVTIRERVRHITKYLSSEERITFRQIVSDAKSRIEVAVTFLALLELVKRYRVNVRQDRLFSDIQIEKRGYIRESYKADLVLVNLNSEWVVSKENILYKCKWSPLEGVNFNSKVEKTFVNGHLVYDNGIFDETQKGEALTFNRK